MNENISRIQKLELLLQEIVANAIKDEIDLDLEVFMTVSRVAISQTMEHATAWISVLPKDKQEITIKRLQNNIGKIQSYVNSHVKTRKVPKIMLKLDTAQEFAEKIQKLIEEIPDLDKGDSQV